MGNNSSFGSLARTLILWAVVALVAIVVFKVIIGVVFGAVQMLFTLFLLGLLAYAVIWAIRKL
jgi:hypothetical protein